MEAYGAAYGPLPEGTSLRRRYTVQKTISGSEEGFAYRGLDVVAGQDVVILEYAPRSVAIRGADGSTVSPRSKGCGALFFLGSEAFLRQYGALTQVIGNPNIVSVFEAFFENGTAYAVTEPLSGTTLSDYPAMTGRALTEGELLYTARSLANALLVVHSLSMLHHDITPEHIFFSTDGTVKLTGFGAARETLRRRREALGEPWEDLYDLGRALYVGATRMRPPADARSIRGRVPEPFFGMFERMLTDDPALRFASVFDLLHMLDGIDVSPIPPAVTEEGLAAFSRLCREREQTRRDRARYAPVSREAPQEPAKARLAGRASVPANGEKRYLLYCIGGAVLLLLAGVVAAIVLRLGK